MQNINEASAIVSKAQKPLKSYNTRKYFWSHEYTYEDFIVEHISTSLKFSSAPEHGKTNKTSQNSAQPGHPPSLKSICCPHEDVLGP